MLKWWVNIKDKETQEKFRLLVEAPTNEEATNKFCGKLLGVKCPYEWLGTEPAYHCNGTRMK